MSSFPHFSKRYLPPIESALSDFIGSLPSACPERLQATMQYSLLAPGKRLRPLLTLLAAEAVGGQVKAALPAASCLEMIHAFSLIHDDLPALDNDDERRGQPACHVKHGESEAILAGDALSVYPFVVLTTAYAPVIASRCCQLLAQATLAMIGGQSDDLAIGKIDEEDQCRSINERKTGALIEAALLVGAVVGGGSEPQLEALGEYGRQLGLAFQITDDLLDGDGVAGSDALTYSAQAKACIEAAKKELVVADLATAELLELADFVLTRES